MIRLSRRSCPARPPRGLKGRLSVQAAHPRGRFGRLLARLWWYETAAVNARALELLDARVDEHVLELGFGPGRAAGLIAEGGSHLVGVDVSAEMVRLATARNARHVRAGRVRLLEGTVTALPLADRSVDAVLAVHNVYFWPDLATGLSEVARVLRPGGRLVLVSLDAAQATPRRFDPRVYRLVTEQQLLDALDTAGLGDEVRVARDGARLYVTSSLLSTSSRPPARAAVVR